MSEVANQFSVEHIKKVLPHRYPFLLVDRVKEINEGEGPTTREGRSVTAIKCVTINEPFFQGHFPQQAVMPGVLLVEAIAQAGALAYFRSNDKAGEIMIASINSAKFRKPVVPGDQLEIKVRVEKDRKKMTVLDGAIFVEGKKVAEANLMAYVTMASESN